MIIALKIILLIAIGTGVWVFKNAEADSSEERVFLSLAWFFIAFIVSLIAFLLVKFMLFTW